MKSVLAAALAALAIALAPVTHAQQSWTEGKDYDLVNPVQKTNVAAGKIEVLEVFSFGCPACNLFQPVIAALQKDLPANVEMVFLPAAFHPEEDWTVFQRAFFAAQSLGIEARTHQQLFDAIWESGELATIDSDTRRMKNPLPSIEDVAKVYEKLSGTKAATFLATARSAAVDQKMKAADAQIVAMQVPGTPTVIVAGKYRINLDSIHNPQDLISMVRFLVGKESHR